MERVSIRVAKLLADSNAISRHWADIFFYFQFLLIFIFYSENVEIGSGCTRLRVTFKERHSVKVVHRFILKKSHFELGQNSESRSETQKTVFVYKSQT